ncbi:MAG: YjjW family glycine radical enzyme activase [Gammaproteobacteria bacterium]|nr:MAG: YjjW family glycine radical enzyme activase [Gammaproteobacteria bacterium]
MSLLQGNVSRILTFSCVDGPGNRLVIFLQGCNFSCRTCHNPHTIGICNHCGDCIGVCPEKALSMNDQGKVVWDAATCTQCDKCLESCPESSSPKTRRYTVDDIVRIVRENRYFLSGITVSGGEATIQLPFVIELFKSIKNDAELQHLSCFLDSNGFLSEKGWVRILPYLDGVMVDLKAWRNENHQWLTGKSNHRVFRSIQYLAAHRKLHEVRIIYVPEFQDMDENIDSLAGLIRELPEATNIRLNAFATHGVTGDAKKWQPCSREQLNAFADRLGERGVTRLTKAAVFQ